MSAIYKLFKPFIVPGIGIVHDIGETVPADGTEGYAKGCLFQHTDATDEDTVLYVNMGTQASSAFKPYRYKTMLMSHPGLAESATKDNELACAAFSYKIDGVLYSKAADTDFAFPDDSVILKAKFGGWLLSIDDVGAISATPCPDVASNKQSYANLAAVQAALPAVPDGECPIGYLVVQAAAGADFTAGSTDLTAATSATFYYDDAIFERLM